jgi:hypothetical protein
MRIAKPLLLVSTPVGVIGGLVAAWNYVGGLVFLMAMMLGVVSVGFIALIGTARAESAASAAAAARSNERKAP